MPKQTDSRPKIRCAEVPRLRTGEDAFLRKVGGNPTLGLKPKGKSNEEEAVEVSEGHLAMCYI